MVAFHRPDLSVAALERGAGLGAREPLGAEVGATSVVPTDPLYAGEQGWVEIEAHSDPEFRAEYLARRVDEIALGTVFGLETPDHGAMPGTWPASHGPAPATSMRRSGAREQGTPVASSRRSAALAAPSSPAGATTPTSSGTRRPEPPTATVLLPAARRTFLPAAVEDRDMSDNSAGTSDSEGPDDPERPLVAVVMAGGTGTRLYPASRPGREKQFLDFGTGRSLLARTLDRTGFADRTFVLASPATAERARGTVRESGHEATVLVEPAARDTGPALVYAAHRVREAVGDCVCCCLPSDHRVGDGFASTMTRAAAVAETTEGLVLLGIEPDAAAIGYGYLKPGEDRGGYHPVGRFYEKPDPGAAARYRQSGYLWNAGTFAWTPAALLRAARDSPLEPLADACERGVPEAGYDAVEAVSIDYAVLEPHAGADGDPGVFVVPATFDWDDLGTWDALDSLLGRDADDNVVADEGGSLVIDSEGCTVAAGPDAHVTLIDCEGLVVATDDDRTLVVPERRADRVGEVVAALRERGTYPERAE